MKLLKGQMSLFDVRDKDKPKRPCDYSFDRAIGQRVYNWRFKHYGRIIKIESYYTDYIVEVGQNGKKNYRQYGTPYELRQATEDENVVPCPFTMKCRTYGIGCQGQTWWCGKEGFK